ncbi:hypothetical protein M9Y10_007749 [Tritrichomonas musculus]|uniref:Uncharacterized protein n=1 Tax=Tritrichomonas musculus TaxID=1915356 RepID=A0ABR2J323_9EUKA
MNTFPVLFKNKTLLIYLQGGIPFIGGTLGDIYTTEDYIFIYGVLSRSVVECDLTDFCPELCDMSNPKRRLFLSPLCDSTERRLSDIACLMGYINHDGFISNDLLCAFASVINFPPLLTLMKKIMKRDRVVYRDLINTFYIL